MYSISTDSLIAQKDEEFGKWERQGVDGLNTGFPFPVPWEPFWIISNKFWHGLCLLMAGKQCIIVAVVVVIVWELWEVRDRTPNSRSQSVCLARRWSLNFWRLFEPSVQVFVFSIGVLFGPLTAIKSQDKWFHLWAFWVWRLCCGSLLSTPSNKTAAPWPLLSSLTLDIH